MLLCVAAGGQPEFKEMDRGLAGDLPEPAEMEREAGRQGIRLNLRKFAKEWFHAVPD